MKNIESGKKQLKLEHISKAETQIMHRKHAFSIRFMEAQRYYRWYPQGNAWGHSPGWGAVAGP